MEIKVSQGLLKKTNAIRKLPPDTSLKQERNGTEAAISAPI